jgi:metallophosphoesterase superfamily enzyme
LHYDCLREAVGEHKPDAVVLVGDALDACEFISPGKLSTAECAAALADLPVNEILFVRGNHEDSNWSEFVSAWPHHKRKLACLYGSACAIGPLVVVGFP